MTYRIIHLGVGIGLWALAGSAMAETLEIEIDSAQTAREARRFLASDAPGSLQHPMALDRADRALEVCRELQKPLTDAPDTDRDYKKKEKRFQTALKRVYSVSIPPKAFRLEDYRAGPDILPIRLNRPLWALDSQLAVNVMSKDDGPPVGFQVSSNEAEGIVAAVKEGRLRLDIQWRPDSVVEALSPCFSVPKSEALSIRVEPLTFSLVDVEKQTSWATVRTPAWDQLQTWVEPGAPTVRIELTRYEGPINVAAVEPRVAELQDRFTACLAPMLESPDASGVAVWSVRLSAKGSVDGTTLVLQSLDDESVVPCLTKVLRETAWPASTQPMGLQILMSVDRPGLEGRESESL